MNFQELSRPSLAEPGNKSFWYPLAEIIKPEMHTHELYAHNYPEGAVVHFTAGRSATDQDALNSLSYGREQGYSYFVIARSGKLFQASPLSNWGYHCGESKHPILGTGLSRKLVGIELANAGYLEKINENKYKSWFGEVFTADQVRYVDEKSDCQPGYYHKFSDQQEYALFNLLIWLKLNNPDVFNLDYVLGHHEISGLKALGHWRKNDPGGSISIPMQKLRDTLKKGFKWNSEHLNGTSGDLVKLVDLKLPQL